MSSEHSPFGFTDRWYALGIVTPEREAELRAEWAREEDRSPEHYRWRAFTAFLEERRRDGAQLPPALAAALYALGARDGDHAMGEAMMHRIVALPECPADVDAAARATGIRHMASARERRRRA